ncbi:uncharacterized protein LOC111639231 isoform X1 [Centruroides sculpturatus]|uniref:uncharacterized protein LOC111639231 isoform X1 n=1 Tax=Centruroides sculpturatus TaxID=218467 RepID=UPI000C6E3174|nr:uncharacterized protein LOC111639231 isoform X1 [Centruroides sculpturatus]
MHTCGAARKSGVANASSPRGSTTTQAANANLSTFRRKRKIFKMAGDSNSAALLMFTNFVLYTSLYVSRRRRRRRFDRRFWIREIFLDRERTGVQNTLIPRLRSFDKEYYFDFLRMSPEKFDELLNKLGPKITRQNTRWRDAIPASDRLAVTLR